MDTRVAQSARCCNVMVSLIIKRTHPESPGKGVSLRHCLGGVVLTTLVEVALVPGRGF